MKLYKIIIREKNEKYIRCYKCRKEIIIKDPIPNASYRFYICPDCDEKQKQTIKN